MPSSARYPSACACAVCFAIPPYMVEYIRRNSKDKKLIDAMAATKRATATLRHMRMAMLGVPLRASAAALLPKLTRRIFDAKKSTDALQKLVRKEGGKASKDVAVNEAYDHSGKTFEFYAKVLGRASVDNNNKALTSSVHYQEDPQFGYDNAFWDGSQMIYGDGFIFNRMTLSLDVVAHELTHGVTQFEAGLKYENESGALNEHMSDVFGVLVRQWANNERDPAKADWSVGRGIFRKAGLEAQSLRSMSAPGTAYNNPDFGKDEQPALMKNFVHLPNTEEGDFGGVHYNSGIPNKAFFLACKALGQPAWDVMGRVWYTALSERLRDNADFKKCAFETISVASDFFGATARKAVAKAWVDVGVIKTGEGPMK